MDQSARAVPLRRLVDTGWLTLLPLVLNFVSLGANAYIIRVLGEAGYGTIIVASGLSGAATILTNLGLRALYTKAVAGADDSTTERLLAEQLGLRLMLGILAGVVTLCSAWLLYPHDRILILCATLQALAVLVTIAWTVLADVLNARERFSQNAVIAFIAGSALTLLSVVAVALGGGPVAVSAAYVVGPIVNFALLWSTLRRLGLRVRVGASTGWARYRHLIVEARALAANDVVSMIHNRAQGVWAPLLFGKALIGVHSAGNLPASRLDMAADSAATAYFPSIATAHRQGEEGVVRAQVVQMFSLILVFTLPLVGFTWFGAPYLASILFPAAAQAESAELCKFIIRVTGIGIPLSGVGVGMRYALQGVGLHARNAKDQMLGSVIGAILTVALALSLGIRGFALAVVARSLVIRWVQSGTFSSAFPGLWRHLPWRPLLTSALVPLAVLGFGIQLVPHTTLVWPVIIATIAGFLYLAVVLRFRVIDLSTS